MKITPFVSILGKRSVSDSPSTDTTTTSLVSILKRNSSFATISETSSISTDSEISSGLSTRVKKNIQFANEDIVHLIPTKEEYKDKEAINEFWNAKKEMEEIDSPWYTPNELKKIQDEGSAQTNLYYNTIHAKSFPKPKTWDSTKEKKQHKRHLVRSYINALLKHIEKIPPS